VPLIPARISDSGSNKPRESSKSHSSRSAAAVLQFGVPALCYFISNNLSIYALSLLPAYSYMLLTNLKIITTGLLNIAVLKKSLSIEQQVSLVLLFLGLSAGNSTVSSNSSSPNLTLNIPQGILVMLIVALCSATATVYTEWVMNHSTFKDESIHLQNARLYTFGIILNAVYYLQDTVRRSGTLAAVFSGFFSHMRAIHWAVVLGLGLMGLVVSAIIKFHGNITKVYASALSMFVAAWASQVLLGESAPPIFYVGAAVAAFAVWLYNSPPGFLTRLCSHQGKPSNSVLVLALLLALVGVGLLYAHGSPSSSITSSSIPAAVAGSNTSSNSSTPSVVSATPSIPSPSAAAMTAAAAAGAVAPDQSVAPSRKKQEAIKAVSKAQQQQQQQAIPVQALPEVSQEYAQWHQEHANPPSIPALSKFLKNDSLAIPEEWLPMETKGFKSVCPNITCSMESSCTVYNSSCCNYLNQELLSFMVAFLHAKGLDREYFGVYGTALGAMRDGTILPWTMDVDLGISPKAARVLESREVREELFQHGYYFFYQGIWRLCPHVKHPSPDFQKGFGEEVAYPGDLPDKAYVDMYSAAPATIATALDWIPKGMKLPKMPLKASLMYNKHLWYLCLNTGWVQVSFENVFNMHGVPLVLPDNLDEHVSLVYGQDWRVPHTSYHGNWGGASYCPRSGLFKGQPSLLRRLLRFLQ
jgi:probable UDP-sugar transporter A4